jgi:hypothetical protein
MLFGKHLLRKLFHLEYLVHLVAAQGEFESKVSKPFIIS